MAPRSKKARAPKAAPISILKTALTPLTDAQGQPRHFAPYRPHLQPCDLCPGRCCRLQVEISLPDAIDLCATLGVPFLAVLTIAPSVEGVRGMILERDPRWVDAEDGWPGRGEIALRRRRDGSCAFLDDHQGYFRCGAYAVRPAACRLYPLSWEQGADRGGPSAILCAVPYAVTPEKEKQFVRDLLRARERWALHEEIVTEWNAMKHEAPPTLDAFLAFAVPRTRERLGVESGPMLEAGSANERLARAMVAAGVLRK
ncbi:MAG: YkgJ family cysteine cluster protein [Deltaproteobacteria bacterium]|nr:YkgJ family cysteine cluster protein [Deltaproteobacteria bacterium]